MKIDPLSEENTSPQKWLEEHGDALYSFAVSRVRDHSIAEDLLQETLLSAFKAHKSFENRSSTKPWLIAILKTKIIDHYRKKSRTKYSVGEQDISELPAVGFGTYGIWNVYVPNWAGAPDKALENQEFMQALGECFKKLPTRSKSVFDFKVQDGMSNEDICKVLEISESNLWVYCTAQD